MANPAPQPVTTRLIRAAQYLRMSTEHQQYSTANQAAAIALYAAAHNIGIVRSFSDEGKSGMTIKGRRGLQELLRVVQSGEADFQVILVYDISRWGRFADADEAAHYEFLCKKAGLEIHYCAEQFDNDNSTTSNLLKALKRTMAGEFSRELSVKVLAGKRRIASLGFRVGAKAPYGLRRQIVSKDGKSRKILQFGEHKSIHTDRTILAAGPKKEVEVVRRIFDLFTKDRKNRTEIVRILHSENAGARESPWTHELVTYMLQNPAYMGTNSLCRCDYKKPRTSKFRNSQDKWVICDGAFEPLVPKQQFLCAQSLLAESRMRLRNEEMLDSLKGLLKRKGTLNSTIIKKTKGTPTTSAYWKHFGGLLPAYRLIGFQPSRDHSTYVTCRRNFNQIRTDLLSQLASGIINRGGTVKVLGNGDILDINDEITARLILIHPRPSKQWKHTWRLNLTLNRPADVLIVVRLNTALSSVLDYFVIPRLAALRGIFLLRELDNPPFIELYRMQNLELLMDSFARIPITDPL